MPIKFPYRFIPGARGVTPRPVIPIQMGLTEESAIYGYVALIDSGADICLFPSLIAKEIGILDITSGIKNRVLGVVAGLSADYYMHRVVVKIGGWPYRMDVGFMSELQKVGYGILGQKGFFENFVVKLNLKKGEIELKRHDS